ncbi:MAG TPA: MFS transporter [Kofleriaceae bacterium]|jgi:OPA family sugar phosphate sensor protein UhpC-like MFS transporter|nr:MFS transporter [Kofleriaceae bacterium]
MSMPLTRAVDPKPWAPSQKLRAWRTKVFIATWLSYVGFYFCRKPFSIAKDAIEVQNHYQPAVTVGNIMAAYLIAYAIGQFLASRVGTWLGPRLNLLIGMALSIAVTLLMGITLSPWLMAGLFAVNGLAQATGWSGNVATMANWFHKHERGKVMGLWATNFQVGSLSAAFALGAVLGDGKAPTQPWQWCFYLGAAVLAVVWVQFFFLQRNEPADVGLPAIDDPVTPEDESREPQAEKLTREQWTNIIIVGGFYFFAKLIRYTVWSWSAYFLAKNYGLSGKKAAIYSVIFDAAGIPGVYVTGWISDRFFKSRRAGAALIMMLGMTMMALLLVLFGGNSVLVFSLLLGAVGFFLYGPDALLSGAAAMDIGSRKTALFATATIAMIGALGPIVQEVIVPRVYNPKDLGLIFTMLFASAIAGSLFCGLLVLRNRHGKGV